MGKRSEGLLLEEEQEKEQQQEQEIIHYTMWKNRNTLNKTLLRSLIQILNI
jgi:hypothetical protein